MEHPRTADVAIVGGGVAGLACAIELQKGGREPLILEASDEVGGRVRTDRCEGFRLDRGFQVFLTAYPEAQRLLDYDRLDLKEFRPGALVRRNGKLHLLADPFREPRHALQALRAPVGSLLDKLRIARLRAELSFRSLEDIAASQETTTLDALRNRGFSDGIVEAFFRPYLGGIFLDPDLNTSSRMFEFVFQMFTQGKAALPNKGIGEAPTQLAGLLASGSIELNAVITEARSDCVVTDHGTVIEANHVVLATDMGEASRLANLESARLWNSTVCLYFAADRPPIDEPLLMLNGESSGLANTIVALDQVAPAYAPPGASLVSVSTIGDPGLDEEVLWRSVQDEMTNWFGPTARSWKRLRMYRIPKALPSQPPGIGVLRSSVNDTRTSNGLWLCGDYRLSSSLNGALYSGRLCAQAILGNDVSG